MNPFVKGALIGTVIGAIQATIGWYIAGIYIERKEINHLNALLDAPPAMEQS